MPIRTDVSLVLQERPAPDTDDARSLLDILASTTADCAGLPAIDAADEQLTYAELARRVSELAQRLGRCGVGPGDRVGVCVPSGSAQLYIAILGVLTAGAAYVPVDADDPVARVAELWESADVCAVIETGLEITERTRPLGAGRRLSVDDDAWVIFTSGSTGRPKAVAVTHRAAAAFVDAEARLWDIDREDRVLAGLSVAFDASCEEMWLAWRHGAALVPAPRAVVRSGEDLGPWLAERRVSVVSTVPTLAAMWDDEVIAGVRLLILGGEACSAELGWRLAAQREVWNTYGPTEATVVSTAGRVRPDEPIVIGVPLAGWRVAVVNELEEPVALGETGELVIAGVGLGRYLDPELDAERFAAAPFLGWDRAYRTGDIVRETPAGLEFVGRRDDQVKVAGRRIELGEIDAQLCAVDGVRAAAATVQRSASGTPVLVGYVTGDVEPSLVRAQVAERLPAGVVPLIVQLPELPLAISGKVARHLLPWPPPRPPHGDGRVDVAAGVRQATPFSGTAAWLADRWADQLGLAPMTDQDDFFEMGGASLAAAKLISVLRVRFPSVAVADVYTHRRLGDLAARLDELAAPADRSAVNHARARSPRALLQTLGLLTLLMLDGLRWVVAILAFDHWTGGSIGPQVGWGWLGLAWLVMTSAPGRAGTVLIARALLVPKLRPGRYPRGGSLACRLWLVERLAEVCHLDSLAGTPWATRYARLGGAQVGRGARLGTLPPVTGLLTVGAGATLEGEIDVRGWWIDGQELVVGEIVVGADARVGTRTLLMPGAIVGEGAEVQPGSVVTGHVPAGERWAGSPARREGRAGESWPTDAPAPDPHPRRWKAMYGVGISVVNLVPVLASIPGLLLLAAFVPSLDTFGSITTTTLAAAPLIAGVFFVTYVLLVTLLFRTAGRVVRPGWHSDDGATAWGLWFTGLLMASSRGVLFPLYASLYTRPWLRLLGLQVGAGTEVSTAVGLSPLVTLGRNSFLTDDVVFAAARGRGGWLHAATISVGDRSFLGNGAILLDGTRVGSDSLVGVLSCPPRRSPDGTSWLGSPAIELPRRPDRPDPSRTTDPPPRLVAARAAVELLRLLLPGTASVAIGVTVYGALGWVGQSTGSVWAIVLVAPVALAGAGLVAGLFTAAAKWLLMGRYRVGEYPLWSFFVWRDELLNTCQEQVAGTWLLRIAMGTPIMSIYLRALGARIGRDAWIETLNVTEFDLVDIGDGCTINRGGCVETHLFHDRLMRTGPAHLGAGSTIGPDSAVLPDTTLGAGATVGARSVVLRGEELPPHSRWHGAPVVAM